MRFPQYARYPTHTVRRISTQRSCFTIHGSNVAGLDKIAQQHDADMVKIVIPRSQISAIKVQLRISGIDEVTIFPDLDGLGRFLTTVLDTETEKK